MRLVDISDYRTIDADRIIEIIGERPIPGYYSKPGTRIYLEGDIIHENGIYVEKPIQEVRKLLRSGCTYGA